MMTGLRAAVTIIFAAIRNVCEVKIPDGMPNSRPVWCWRGETGKRSNLASCWAKALVGSNPAASTVAHLLTNVGPCRLRYLRGCEASLLRQ